MISDGMKYRLSIIKCNMDKEVDELRQKKAMGYNIDREVRRLEKFATEHGASKDWRYNSDNLRDVYKLVSSVHTRLCMDIDGYHFENPDHWKRIEEMENFFTGENTGESIGPQNINDARRLIRQTNDPDAVMNIITSLDDANDKRTLMQENQGIILNKVYK